MVTEEERRRMKRLADDLKAIECRELVDFDGHGAQIEWMNESRARKGLAPLKLRQDIDDPPEQELYRRAKALGMGPWRRRDH